MVERGFVVYSNEAKQELLGVPAATLAAHGAVSEETARAMAEGALAHSRADFAVSVTGVAGPGRRQRGKTGRPRPFRLRGEATDDVAVERRFGASGAPHPPGVGRDRAGSARSGG